ncbi:MAG: hypothetical protein ACTS73_04460 [Arsenophonus sp. NEOnobi-MAG3]
MDNLSNEVDSCIEATHFILSCPYCHSEDVIRWADLLWLQRYR